ncbi:carbohydrate esterase family 16 protein [Heterobasidion irregulare TC 32-1]|uniref:Carbohydrate esterase family 16 protein n=1 Tax=Heterobasidion irregulare (strain TC 32-1) TaxID=747525 RepID=W4KET9_HETIT|nr:carbohydrate esterase family 16 protein [Heterobasidion irregulare TC 32-1]ETW83815.1 carbohydrate esterase family 16 protein [Heterobasidion irregulare TC 32-1]
MSSTYRLGPYWQGYGGIKKLVIFGDSYSYVGYHSQAPPPTAARPLGVPFPGVPVNEPGQSNWVGHLITSHSHGQANILVYDYAVRGDTAPGVRRQILEQFLPTVGRKPRWASWTAAETLFVTWVGTNDCRLLCVEIQEIVRNLFAAQEQLYRAGARNFVFIDVPPIHRSPVGPIDGNNTFAQPFLIWNEELRSAVANFTALHPDVTSMVFSSWGTFSSVLDTPTAYGMRAQDTRVMGGTIWYDHIHPSTRLASVVARDLAAFLAMQPPTA